MNRRRKMETLKQIRQPLYEAEHQTAVIREFESRRYIVAHNYDSRLERLSGVPDLTAYHRDTEAIVIMELKRESEYLTPEQCFTMRCWRKAGVYAVTLRPSDYQSGLVERIARHYAEHTLQGGFDDCTICPRNH